ncbi:ChaN family lipoprotein [Penaeicola halotolerans]|uniref:ChaN family lipoprotein n=1 Tax=Penaeicola halotolerans TaxID=2793196 RepID=UPI001CF8834E|nr:ChaN family lipoprotein [Penaeicola halotolerans]
MRKILFLVVIIFLPFFTKAQDLPTYKIFDKEGVEVSFGQMSDALGTSEVVLFGELHNESIIHWLQLQLLKDLHTKGKSIAVGMEMFEADDQLVIDEYWTGNYAMTQFEAEVKLWNNYKVDYKPILEYAKASKLPFVATNIPRRYANMVSKQGKESLLTLSEDAKSYMMPLPLVVDKTLPGYAAFGEMMGHNPQMNIDYFIEAQAVKDATMAHFIMQNLVSSGVFIHYHGTYHSNNFEGIYWYLKQSKSDLKIKTIASVSQAEISNLASENIGLADFIIVVPMDSPKSY